jgi:hypothetical protein
MTRARRSLFARLALLVCGGLTLPAPRADAKQVAPFRTALAVHWGQGAGSDAFRDDLSRTLAANLAGRCFAGVTFVDRDPSPADAELVFSVILSGVVDETRFDDSIATTLQPGEPAKELRHFSHFEVTVDATLSTRATGAPVGRKHLIASASHRPLYPGEDAQATARLEVIDNIVRDLGRALGCGGAKLERKIRDALGAAGEASPAPR